MEATEKTMTIELTETQYTHIQEILRMNRPSRTRLTSTEKGIISDLLEGIIGELSCIHLKNEYGEPTHWEQVEFDDAQKRIKEYKTILKKLS